ncbi:MAG: hypothetical protein WDM96_18215 [Lacunisphaera sp.]
MSSAALSSIARPSLFGPETIESLARWHFDAAFLGGEGMDADGISNSHPEIAAFQQAVIGRSERTFFCLDSSKLGRATPHRVTAWRPNVALITDATAAQLATRRHQSPRRPPALRVISTKTFMATKTPRSQKRSPALFLCFSRPLRSEPSVPFVANPSSPLSQS